jgi:hypothetical protein
VLLCMVTSWPYPQILNHAIKIFGENTTTISSAASLPRKQLVLCSFCHYDPYNAIKYAWLKRSLKKRLMSQNLRFACTFLRGLHQSANNSYKLLAYKLGVYEVKKKL